MPYRRLPTTDKARIRALEAALLIAEKKGPEKLAFSKKTLAELKIIKTNFENKLKHYEFDLKTESDKNANYKAALEKAKLYVSHFIQVLYMNIERGELNENVLSFYGLIEMNEKIPSLNNEHDILDWGEKIISGEQKRIQHGGSPVYNPSIALVKVNVENFYEASVFQHTLKRNTHRSYERIQNYRKETNDFISKLWTEIEENIGNIPPKIKRQYAQEYGVVYVFRRNERKKIKMEGLQVDLLFEFN